MQLHDLSLAELETLRAALELYRNMGQLADTNGHPPRFSLVPGQPVTITLPAVFEAFHRKSSSELYADLCEAARTTRIADPAWAELVETGGAEAQAEAAVDPAPIEADGPGNAMDETDDIARQLLTPDEYETWSMYWSMDPALRWMVVPVTVAGLIEARPKVEAAPEVEPAAEAEPAAAPQPEPPAQPVPAPEPLTEPLTEPQPDPVPEAAEATRPARWSDEETEIALGLIVQALKAGRSAYTALKDIAAQTGRPQPSIQQRIKREWKAEIAARLAAAQAAPSAQLGLEMDPLTQHLNAHAGKGGWTIAEDYELFRLAGIGWKVPEIATEMGRDGQKVQRRFDLLIDRKGAKFLRADVAARLAAMLPPDAEA